MYILLVVINFDATSFAGRHFEEFLPLTAMAPYWVNHIWFVFTIYAKIMVQLMKYLQAGCKRLIINEI